MKVIDKLKKLFEKGFLYLPQQNEQVLYEILAILGRIIQITDVTIKPNSKGLVTSARALDFHTDHHKAKYIVWYCYKQSDKGGETLLLDALPIYQNISETFQRQLQNIYLYEHKVFADDCESYPLVSLGEDKIPKFYYSFWLVKDTDKHNPALIEFQKLIRQAKPLKFRMQPNDILIVNNHRIFHGRTAIEGNQDRLLKRFWLSEK